MGATLKMIAAEAGVSVGAVSQVLHNSGRMAPEKRKLILAIAARLRYRPNLLVHSLQSGRTRMIGVMIPILSEYQAKLLNGIHDELVAADHVPITVWGDPGVADGVAYELAQLHRLVDRRVDGILMTSPHALRLSDMDREVQARKIPLVLVGNFRTCMPSDVARVDDQEGGRLAAEHLLALGHRQLAVLEEVTMSLPNRQHSFAAAVAAAGGHCVRLRVPSPFKSEEIDTLVAALRKKNRPTAIFCITDFLATRVYQAAAQLGLRIPQDLSVVGFANLDLTHFMIPRLTTIDQFTYDIGRAGARLLLKRLAKGRSGAPWETAIVTPKLVCRDSTAAPRG